jgi:hypothetical protein
MFWVETSQVTFTRNTTRIHAAHMSFTKHAQALRVSNDLLASRVIITYVLLAHSVLSRSRSIGRAPYSPTSSAGTISRK